MCGRCCAASMPRSPRASWGLSRRRCPTSPSWRPLTTSSTNSRGSQARPSLKPLSPFPCRRGSLRQPLQGRRKRRRIGVGQRRARLKAANSGLSLSSRRSEERRVGKSVDLGGRRIIKKKKKKKKKLNKKDKKKKKNKNIKKKNK